MFKSYVQYCSFTSFVHCTLESFEFTFPSSTLCDFDLFSEAPLKFIYALNKKYFTYEREKNVNTINIFRTCVYYLNKRERAIRARVTERMPCMPCAYPHLSSLTPPWWSQNGRRRWWSTAGRRRTSPRLPCGGRTRPHPGASVRR